MKLENIIQYPNYIILSYFLIIVGVLIANTFRLENIKDVLFYVMIFLVMFLPILNIILSKIFKKNEKESYIKIDIPQLNLKYTKPIDKTSFNKFINHMRKIGMIILILIPIFCTIYYYYSLNLNNNYISLLTIAIIWSLNYSEIVRKQLFNETYIVANYAFIGALSLNMILLTPQGFYLINLILNYIFNNMHNAFTILIAIIMLCIGLSALSFSYCSILPDDKVKENIKKNGEGYFIASILTMFAIVFLFIDSIISQHVNLILLKNINVWNFEFILLNLYSTILIIIFSFSVYSSYCMIKCSILSLKELKAFQEFI